MTVLPFVLLMSTTEFYINLLKIVAVSLAEA